MKEHLPLLPQGQLGRVVGVAQVAAQPVAALQRREVEQGVDALAILLLGLAALQGFSGERHLTIV